MLVQCVYIQSTVPSTESYGGELVKQSETISIWFVAPTTTTTTTTSTTILALNKETGVMKVAWRSSF